MNEHWSRQITSLLADVPTEQLLIALEQQEALMHHSRMVKDANTLAKAKNRVSFLTIELHRREDENGREA